MNNQNNLKNKSERNSKKLRSFGAICEGIHAKLARNPGTRNFVGFAAVVVLVLVVWSFATETPKAVTLSRETTFHSLINMSHGPVTELQIISGMKVQPGNTLKYISETDNTVIVKSPGSTRTFFTEEIPKDCIVEFGGKPGAPIFSTLILTLFRQVEFTDGTAPVGTKVKYIAGTPTGKFDEKTHDTVTIIPPNKTAEDAVSVPRMGIMQLGGSPGDTIIPTKPILKPYSPEEKLRKQKENAAIQEVIESAKANTPLTRTATDKGNNNKVTYNNGTKYISEVDTLKEIPKPVTNAETHSLRPEFQKMEIHPRKATYGGQDVCTLHVISTALEFLGKKDGSEKEQISLAYLRWLHPANSKHQGADFKHVIDGINTKGAASEPEFPLSQIGKTPPTNVQEKAKLRKKVVAHGISRWNVTNPEFDVNNWGLNSREISNQIIMHEIKNGRPILIGCMFPLTDESNLTIKDLHYTKKVPHAILIVGYNTKDGTVGNTTYEFLNSRGENWGDRGYGICWARDVLGSVAFSLSLE